MNVMNTIELQGNLTMDPEVKTTKTGKTLTTFSIAVNKMYTTKSGERGKKTSYFRIVAWETLGKAASFLTKGQNVMIRGSSDSSDWKDSEGNKHTTSEVTAYSISIPINYLFKDLVKDQGTAKAAETKAEESTEEVSDPWTGFGKRVDEPAPVEPGKPLL